MPARLFLFDIDGTLLYTGGAGSKAMEKAFADLFDISDGFSQISFTGRTDTAILTEVLRFHSIDPLDGALARLKERYLQLLPQTLPQNQGYLLPGVEELLRSLQQAPSANLGLATGNLRQGALLKLQHYGIDEYFGDGGFGDDFEDRTLVVKVAIERLAPDGEAVIVIGDTPLDIVAGKANGAHVVAVATGRYSPDDLSAAGADMVFADFSGWQDAAATLLSLA